MIQNVDGFIRYFDGIRRRTLYFARAVPSDRLDWAPEGEMFTCGDLLRHIAAIEKITVYAAVNQHWTAYPGHERELAPDMDAVIAHLEAVHEESKRLLRTLPDAELHQLCIPLTGRPVKTWRLLMSIIEHEVHHRSQLASYLSTMGVEPPQIFGLHVDDVVALSSNSG